MFDSSNIMNFISGNIYWKDRNGAILGCNECLAKLAGLSSKNEIIGKTDFELPWKDKAEAIRAADEIVMTTGKTFVESNDLVNAEGKTEKFYSTRIPLKDNVGSIYGVLSISVEENELNPNCSNGQKTFNEPLQDNYPLKIEKIIDLLPANIYWKDCNGVVKECNEAQAKNFGFTSRSEVIGKDEYQLMTKEMAENIRARDRLIFAEDKEHLAEEEVVLANGQSLVFLSRKIPLKDEQGKTQGILGISIDITEQKQAEEREKEALARAIRAEAEMQAEKERYKLTELLENIVRVLPGHVYWKNRNFILEGCNNRLAQSFGFKDISEIIGLTDYELVNKDLSDITRANDVFVMETGQSISVEEKAILADGSLAIFLSQKTPLKDQDNNIIGILGISFDITEQRLLEQKEKDALAREIQAEEERRKIAEQLVATLAHEMRTPFQIINMNAQGIERFMPYLIESYRTSLQTQFLKQEVDNDELNYLPKRIQMITAEVKYAFNFINLLLANINESSVNNVKQEVCSINACIKRAIERYPFAGKENERINWVDQDFSFFGNEDLVIHLFFNLMKNALHYIQAAGKGEINIWIKKNDNFNELHFKDTGKGISPEVLPHIFDRFFSQRHHGTGVGLSFSKSVMLSFGGDIACESVEGQYAEFIMKFPVYDQK